jgi:hypothetical protein
MPGMIKRIRGEMDVRPTLRDKDLTLMIRVTAYAMNTDRSWVSPPPQFVTQVSPQADTYRIRAG